MYNLQRYSSALLVLVFHIKTLTGLPYEIQAVPVAQPQLIPLSASNIPAEAIPVDVRSLNVSESNPSLRSLDAQTLNASVALEPPAFRSLPSNPADPPQQEDIAARNGFGLENPQKPSAVETPGMSLSQDSLHPRFNSAQMNTNLSTHGNTPVLRSGLEDLTGNISSVEERSLNISSPSSTVVALRATNETQVEARNLDLNSAPQAAAVSSSNTFVPSFLKSFGLRQKRGEEDSSELTVSGGSEQASPVNNSPYLAERSSLEQAVPVSNDDAVPAARQLNLNVATNDANAASRLELVSVDPAGSSSVIVPYINVYPVDNLEF